MDKHLRGDAREAVEVKLTLGGHSVDMTADADAVRELRKVFVRVGQSGSTAIYGHIVLPSGPVGRVHGIEVALRNGCDMRKASEEASARARIHEAEALLKKMDVSDDKDEGLRDGPVVGGLSSGFGSRSDAEAFDLSPEGMRRRIAFAEDLVRRIDAVEPPVSAWDWIRANCPAAKGDEVVSMFGRPEPDNDLNLWDAELRAEQAERRAAILERSASAEFEWEGQIDIGTDPLSPVPVRIRSTEAGILGVEETIQRLHARVAELEAETTGAVDGADIQPSADGATTYTVSCGDASMTVTGSASGVAALVKLAYGGFEYGVST